jgi:hypothetical protein
MDLQKALDYLGLKAKDKISGVSGVITSVAFDLYGCVQVIIKPQKADEKGEPYQGSWFDINRLQITSKKRVMELLDFTQKYPTLNDSQGPENKPMLN